jgi:exonuclease III
VIVVGDWNVIQNYDKDTINYQSANNRRSRAQVKVHQMMNNLDLIDIWRMTSEIGISYRSDHSPVCMKF